MKVTKEAGVLHSRVSNENCFANDNKESSNKRVAVTLHAANEIANLKITYCLNSMPLHSGRTTMHLSVGECEENCLAVAPHARSAMPRT